MMIDGDKKYYYMTVSVCQKSIGILTLHVSPETKINLPSSNECSVMPWQQSMNIIHPVNQGGQQPERSILGGAIPSIMFQAHQYVVDEVYSLVWREVVFCSCSQYIISCFTSRTPCCCARLLWPCILGLFPAHGLYSS